MVLRRVSYRGEVQWEERETGPVAAGCFLLEVGQLEKMENRIEHGTFWTELIRRQQMHIDLFWHGNS